jgi:intein/homing endonuclease
VRVLSLLFVPIVISTGEKEKNERNVEEENTIRLLADWLAGYMDGDPEKRRKKRSVD